MAKEDKIDSERRQISRSYIKVPKEDKISYEELKYNHDFWKRLSISLSVIVVVSLFLNFLLNYQLSSELKLNEGMCDINNRFVDLINQQGNVIEHTALECYGIDMPFTNFTKLGFCQDGD